MNIRSAAALAGFVFFAIAAPAIGDVPIEGRPDLAIPPESGLQFQSSETGGMVSFKGSIKLSGTYYYGKYNESIILYLVPDDGTKARLPHFQYFDRPGAIYIVNQESFGRAVIPREQLAKLKPGDDYLTGQVRVVVDHYKTGIECDTPNAEARFVSVVDPRLAAAEQTNMLKGGC